MLLTVKLVQKRSRVLAVPEESVIPIQNTQYVYVVEDGTAQRVEIDVGRRRPGFVEVLSGLVEGQEVITQGIIKVRPGSRVTLMSDQATQARSGPGIESTGKKTGRKGKKSGRPGKSG